MSWDRIESNRKKLRGSIRHQTSKLSDEQLDLIAAKRGRLPQNIDENSATHSEVIDALEIFDAHLSARLHSP